MSTVYARARWSVEPVAAVWLVVGLLLAAYAALPTWGPRLTSVDGLVVQVVAQKVATVIVLVAVLLVSREMDRAPTPAPAVSH